MKDGAGTHAHRDTHTQRKDGVKCRSASQRTGTVMKEPRQTDLQQSLMFTFFFFFFLFKEKRDWTFHGVSVSEATEGYDSKSHDETLRLLIIHVMVTLLISNNGRDFVQLRRKVT